MQDWEREVLEAQKKKLETWQVGIDAAQAHINDAHKHLTTGLLVLRAMLATQAPVNPVSAAASIPDGPPSGDSPSGV